MKADTTTNFFHGKVRYTSLSTGTVSWKSGGLSIKQDECGWKMDMVYRVNPDRSVLSLRLDPSRIKKVVCKDQLSMEVSSMDKNYVTVRYNPDNKMVMRSLEDLLTIIRKPAVKASLPKSEMGVMRSLTSQHTSCNAPTSPEPMDMIWDKENTSPQHFTSVKSNSGSDSKRIPNILSTPTSHGTENAQYTSVKKQDALTLPSLSFYSQSSPSPKPIFKASYSRPFLGKRTSSLSDMTPSKRRLSDSISYSMKSKPDFKSEEPKLASLDQKQTMVGFSNMGNTCYINAVLQALLCIDTLSNDLLSNRKLLRNLSPSSLYYCLVKLLHVKRQPLQTADTARTEWLLKIKAAIASSAKRFSGNEQHDAHEFLCQLLDQLKEELNKLSHSTPSPVKENSNSNSNNNYIHANENTYTNPITVNFEFEVLHTLTCKRCQDTMTKTEHLVDIPLQFPKRKDMFTPRSLQDALTMFFKDEVVDHTCEKCGHQQKSVSHRITRLPRVFILQLKRYIYNQAKQRNTKMGAGVRVPLYLTLQNHSTEETVPAHPPSLLTPGDSECMTSPHSDESREDVISRRRLDYPGLTMKTEGSNVSSNTTTPTAVTNGDHSFTSTKDKVTGAREIDQDMETALRHSHEQLEEERKASENVKTQEDKSSQNVITLEDNTSKNVITLEDEDNEQLSKAIELSLREHEEKNKLVQDYGGDDEMERVMELSMLSYHETEAQRLANQSLEDKENTTPPADRPQLSEPSEFEEGFQDEVGSDEVDGFVEESLDLPEIHNEAGNLPYSYRLVSVVKHEGVSSLTGHYTSDVYNFKKKAWYKCDDKHVMRVTESEMKRRGETDGYIFFYMSKDVFDDLTINHDMNTTCKS